MIALGVDVGGTFTDLILADLAKGTVTIHKTPSTPNNSAEGVVGGVKEICEIAGVTPDKIEAIFHGTTVGTNAMLVHDGAVTGMITNEGFRDIPVIFVSGRSSSEDLARGKEVGASAYFVKPLDLDALIARIRTLVPSAGAAPSTPKAP